MRLITEGFPLFFSCGAFLSASFRLMLGIHCVGMPRQTRTLYCLVTDIVGQKEIR